LLVVIAVVTVLSPVCLTAMANAKGQAKIGQYRQNVGQRESFVAIPRILEN
jgi:hypothetical protein